ncbi:MAG: T9SS type A sorting domain-containing protein [Bacteroidales bacterium]|nr:T9SS type A sorting domain-containing protein [Bacteroidales bacterium]
MRLKCFLLLTIISLSTSLFAQDTIRMMQYNLMYYTDNSGISDCNSSTNNLANKDENVKTIFQYVKPDVFCVCEMGSNMTYVNRLLNNAINVDGVDYYRNGPLTNYSGGSIANMIYYDSRKLTLYDNYYVTTSYRDINGYKMYYNSTDLEHGDTVFVTFWIMHLKAGSSDANAAARYVQTQRLMSRLEAMGAPDNYVVSGDFNVYGASENCYQELVNYSNSFYRFYDPIDRPGEWNNNGQFADIHTQSTHTESTGCFSTGGMDDRFDIILVSPYINYGSQRVKVLPETYHALGQDGNRFNKSIIYPANNSIPSAVAQALYNQSDHLPVITDFAIEASPVGVQERAADFSISAVNPVRDNLTVNVLTPNADVYQFQVYAMDGRLLAQYEEALDGGCHTVRFPFEYAKGLYVLKVTDSRQQQQVWKLVK